MSLVILIIILAIIVIIRRDFKSFIYTLGVAEIFLRILTFIADNIGTNVVSDFIHKYIPSSIPSILATYSSGLLFTILEWIFVIFMGILGFYLIKYLIKRK